MDMDRLTSQLNYLPAIIGRMGINIAEAQQELNAEYLKSLHKAVDLIHSLLATAPASNTDDAKKEVLAAVETLLEALAPSHYQFTESTIDFSADLAESMDLGVNAGFGVGMSGISLSAGMALAFGYDYRAAARINAKLHAINPSKETTKNLLARAKEVDAQNKGKLPELNEPEKEIRTQAKEAFKTFTRKDVPA